MKIIEKTSHVLQREDIELHGRSVESIERIFNMYTSAPEKLSDNTAVSNPVIHLYAKEDTIDSNGDINGYSDSLFFEAVVYDTVKMLRYSLGLRDGVEFTDECSLPRVHVFKDGSTTLTLFGDYCFRKATSITVRKAVKTMKHRSSSDSDLDCLF